VYEYILMLFSLLVYLLRSRFMNKYFLLIAVLQLWPLITPVSPVSTWGPLLAIFTVSATKEAWDDYGRYCSDKEFNEKHVWVVKDGSKTCVCFLLSYFLICPLTYSNSFWVKFDTYFYMEVYSAQISLFAITA